MQWTLWPGLCSDIPTWPVALTLLILLVQAQDLDLKSPAGEQ